jgi:LPXTG-motif cell wall-anchored protein
MAVEVAISTLGGPQYPDGSSGYHIPRRALALENSSYVSHTEPRIALTFQSKGAGLAVGGSAPPLSAVASRKATSGVGYVVFFARPGVRMLARIEGLDEKLAGIESSVMSGPYALFPHQASAARAACGDDFLHSLTQRGVLVERHCAYDEHQIGETTMPTSSGLLAVTTQRPYGSLPDGGIGMGDYGCACNGRLERTTMDGDNNSFCVQYDVRKLWQGSGKQHEMLLVSEDTKPNAPVLRIFKADSKDNLCSSLIYSRMLLYDSTNSTNSSAIVTTYSCYLAIWRCNRKIGSMQANEVVRMPAEITLIWEFAGETKDMPHTYYAEPSGRGHKPWSVRQQQTAGDYKKPVPFPYFMYTFSYVEVTSFNDSQVQAEYEAYKKVCYAMDVRMYVVTAGKQTPLMESDNEFAAGAVAVRATVQLEQNTSASEAPADRTFATVAHVLLNASTGNFTLVSIPGGSRAVTCTLRVSPLSPLWHTLHALSSGSPPVALDPATLTAIGFSASESGAWIPLVSQAENAGPTHTSTTRTTATPLEFGSPGAVADTPAPSGLASAPVPSPFFSTGSVPHTQTGTVAVPTPTTGVSENAGYSALIGVAVLAVVGILLLRARKRRRR